MLTAAHVVYDDLLFSFQPVGRVKWFFQRYAGSYEPPPKLPRGWCVFTSYSAQRIADDTPGISSLASEDLDVAALPNGAVNGVGVSCKRRHAADRGSTDFPCDR